MKVEIYAVVNLSQKGKEMFRGSYWACENYIQYHINIIAEITIEPIK